MVALEQWLNVRREDIGVLGVLALPFVLAAGVAVILASASKGLFLASNDISRLPLMFLGSAAITAVASMAYLGFISRTSLTGRTSVLLAGGGVSLLLLRAAFYSRPSTASVALLLWGPTVGHLVIVQVWNVATSALSTRQAKRLVPLLAALTTAGAAAGGGLVQVLLRWLSAEDLLYVVAGLLFTALVHARTKLGALLRAQDGTDDGGTAASTKRAGTANPPEGALLAGVRAIVRSPLLSDLTLFVFLLQVASVVVDYQFSAELKPRFSKEGIASFLGIFYMMSNLVVLAFTLRLTGPLVKRIGVGFALAASAVVLGLGSAGYAAATITAVVDGFWVLVATAFAERVIQYGHTKPATQMAYMPLSAEQGERAKTLIDGVVYRLATAIVSVTLIYVGPTLQTQFRLSPPVALACAAAIYLGWRVTPSYRRALFDALRGHRLDPERARALRDNLGSADVAELAARLASNDAATVLRALDLVKEFKLAVPAARLNELLLHEDERIVVAALACAESLGHVPDDDTLSAMLAPDRPAALLRVVVQVLANGDGERYSEHVRGLVRHPDASVAAAACVLRIRAIGGVDRFADEVASSQREGAGADGRLTGMTRASEFARELPELIHHPDPALRQNAIEQMGQLPLRVFVAPLIACLNKADAREEASAALLRHGRSVVPAAARSLSDNDLSLAARVALMKLCEQLADKRAVSVLLDATVHANHALRGHAVNALWRLTTADGAVSLDSARLRKQVLAELSLLRSYDAAAEMLGGPGSARHNLLLHELEARRRNCERRSLRLLGMITARPAVKRVLLHYRSPDKRVRSNALELLEQHLTEPEFMPLLAMIERGAKQHVTTVAAANVDAAAASDVLVDDEWLASLWRWASSRDSAERNTELRWADRNDRIVMATQVPMLAKIAGEHWADLVEGLKRTSHRVGERLVQQGDDARQVFWVMKGKVSVLRAGRELLSLGASQCFGELAFFDGEPRSAHVDVNEDAMILSLDTALFRDALELHPGLQLELVSVLTNRLRTTIAMKAESK